MYLLTCQYFGRMEKKLSHRKVAFCWLSIVLFKKVCYERKESPKGTSRKLFALCTGVYLGFLLQALGWWHYHNVQRGINPPPLIGQPPLKMKIFWPPPHRTTPHLKMEIFWPPPNFYSFPDFLLEESVWHAISLWGHWKACSFFIIYYKYAIFNIVPTNKI